jgi:arylsulfatase A-like enzyme
MMKTTLLTLALLLLPLSQLHAAPRLNILFFTADDMNFDSSGVYGGPIKDLTPNLDRLAAEGLRFQQAYFVSTLDFAPTLLEAAGLPPIPGIDGRSFLPAVQGETMTGWDRVFTFYNAAFGNRWLPMRCVRTKERSYIWNAWSDGQRPYQTENMAGLTWKAMLAAAATNAAIKDRTDFYLHRVPEELYDLTNDRCERTNLIGDPSRQAEIVRVRRMTAEERVKAALGLGRRFASLQPAPARRDQ